MAKKEPKKRVLKQDPVKGRTDRAGAPEDGKPRRIRKFFKTIFKPLFFVLRPLFWVLKKITPRYFKNSFAELKLVTWPTRKETRQLTTAVLMFAIVLGTSVAFVDLGLDKLFKKVILKQ